jgi:DNA-directed RNA polymerase subunit RPC12/RpoP
MNEPEDPRPNIISLGDGEDGAYYLCGVCDKEFSVKFGDNGSYNYPEICPHCSVKFLLGDDMLISDDSEFLEKGISDYLAKKQISNNDEVKQTRLCEN